MPRSPIPEYKKPPKRKRKWRSLGSLVKKHPSSLPAGRLKVIVSLVLIWAVFWMLLGIYSRAEVVIKPRQEFPDLIYNLTVDNEAGTPFKAEKFTMTQKVSRAGNASGIAEFKERARGTITIFNAYSSESQKLVRRTRFQTSDGKIYRIQKPMIVPGAKIVEGSIEPSSIEVEVVAEEPGQEYNIGLSDFTIPGFKGGVKFEKFYARSKTPMEGGFVGTASVVLEEDISRISQKMESDLQEELFSQARGNVPEGLFIPEGGTKFEIVEAQVEPPASSRADRFTISLTGELQTFLLSWDDIEQYVLERNLNAEVSKTRLADVRALRIEATNIDFDQERIVLAITGEAHIIWNVDHNKLTKDLVSAEDTEGRIETLRQYAMIESATIDFRPRWWRIFPQTTRKVTVEEEILRP